jgi:hypothetical protein
MLSELCADACGRKRTGFAGAWPRQMRNGYRELDGTQLSGTLTRRRTCSMIVNPRFR